MLVTLCKRDSKALVILTQVFYCTKVSIETAECQFGIKILELLSVAGKGRLR